MAYYESFSNFISAAGWAIAFVMLNFILMAIFMVLVSLQQYLRDRNQREAADARVRMLLTDRAVGRSPSPGYPPFTPPPAPPKK